MPIVSRYKDNSSTGSRVGQSSLRPAVDRRTSDGRRLMALSEAIQHCRNLWVAFITYTVTICVIAAGTTSVGIALDAPTSLPLFNIGVPLQLFYFITPLFLLLFHISFLLRLHDLRLRAAGVDPSMSLRTQVPAFDYFLRVMGLEKTRVERVLVGAIAITTIYIAPVLAFLFLEKQILPGHYILLLWWLRGLIVADLSLALLVRFAVVREPLGSRSFLVSAAAIVAATGFSAFVLAVPGEATDFLWPRSVAGFDPAERFGIVRSLDLRGLHLAAKEPPPEVLAAFVGRQSDPTNDLTGAAGRKAQDTRSLAERLYGEPLNLTHRDLSYANLSRAVLIEANFDGADLSGADLSYAQLTGAQFNEARVQRTVFDHANLRGTSFRRVAGTLASFNHADLTGVVVDRSLFIGGDFRDSTLVIASLSRSNFDATTFEGANLTRVRVMGDSMVAANLSDSKMHDSRIWSSDLRGADFRYAEEPDRITDDISYADFSNIRDRGASDPTMTAPGFQSGEDGEVKAAEQEMMLDAQIGSARSAHGEDTNSPDYDDENELPPCCLVQIFQPSRFARLDTHETELEARFPGDVDLGTVNSKGYPTALAAFLVSVACQGPDEPHPLFKDWGGNYPVLDRHSDAWAIGLAKNRLLAFSIYPPPTEEALTQLNEEYSLLATFLRRPCFTAKLDKATNTKLREALLRIDTARRNRRYLNQGVEIGSKPVDIGIGDFAAGKVTKFRGTAASRDYGMPTLTNASPPTASKPNRSFQVLKPARHPIG